MPTDACLLADGEALFNEFSETAVDLDVARPD